MQSFPGLMKGFNISAEQKKNDHPISLELIFTNHSLIKQTHILSNVFSNMSLYTLRDWSPSAWLALMEYIKEFKCNPSHQTFQKQICLQSLRESKKNL